MHTSRRFSVISAAKINLYLDVIGKRDDGYHEIETVFQPVSLWDEIEFVEIADGVEISGRGQSIPWDERNLCVRAARKIFESVGFRGGVRLSVKKRIPAGAGLGGGSSDAAAVLVGLNEMFDFGLTLVELSDLGLELGSDVPFFIGGKPAIGRGRGEILEEIPGLREGWILVVKPSVSVSTKWAYKSLNLMLTTNEHGDRLKRLVEVMRISPGCKLETHNSFECMVVTSFPEIGRVLSVLRGGDPVLCSLSGSGSACFAVFGEECRAKEVMSRFKSEGVFTEIVQPVNRAMKLLQRG